MSNETDKKLYCVSQFTDNPAGGQDWVYFFCLAHDSGSALEIGLEQCDEEGDIFDRNAIAEQTTFCSMAKHSGHYLAGWDVQTMLAEWRKDNSDGGTLDLFTTTTRPTLPGDAQRVTEAIERAGAIRTTAGGERA